MKAAACHPVHIGEVIHRAMVFNLRNQRGDAMEPETLRQTVTRFFALLHERQIEYLLVGGIAMLHYVEGRNTEDIDLIVALPALQQLPEVEITRQDEYFAQGRCGELHLDFLLTRNPLFDLVLRRHATVRLFAERDIACATVEGLILLKLYALPSLYRQGNFARVGLYENDLATMLQAYRPDLESLFAELRPHLGEGEMRSLRDLVAELQQRLERFRRNSGT